jgi:hypothetical protein
MNQLHIWQVQWSRAVSDEFPLHKENIEVEMKRRHNDVIIEEKVFAALLHYKKRMHNKRAIQISTMCPYSYTKIKGNVLASQHASEHKTQDSIQYN